MLIQFMRLPHIITFPYKVVFIVSQIYTTFHLEIIKKAELQIKIQITFQRAGQEHII